MTSKSEDVLLQVSQVRYKKGDGTLYLMSERLAWILDHKDTVCVSHRYADIKREFYMVTVSGLTSVSMVIARQFKG